MFCKESLSSYEHNKSETMYVKIDRLFCHDMQGQSLQEGYACKESEMILMKA